MTVYMAVREEPVPYLQLNSGGQTRFYDDFYGLYQHIREMQGFYLLRAVLCAAGAVCLIAAHFLRAERRRAEKKAGRSHSLRARGDLVAGGCPGSPLHGVLHRIRRLLSL